MSQRRSTAESQLGLPEYRGHTLVERSAFALLVLFIIVAMVGLFGDGPASEAVATSSDGQLRVEYQRFSRRDAPQSLDITLPTRPGTDRVELHVNSDYLRRVQITEIFPQPVQSIYHQRGSLSFATDGSGEPMTVRLHLESQHAGLHKAHITARPADKQAQVTFTQIVYP